MAQFQSTGLTGSISIKTTDGFNNKLIGECNSIYAKGAGPQCHIAIGECIYPDSSFGISGLTITNGGSGYGTPTTTTRPSVCITSTDEGTGAWACVVSYNSSISNIGVNMPGYRYSGNPSCTTVNIIGGTGTGATAEVSAFSTASRNIGIGYNIGEHAGYLCDTIAIGSNILNITGSAGYEGSALACSEESIYLGKDIAIGCNNCNVYSFERFNTYIGNSISCRIGCTSDVHYSQYNVGIGHYNFWKMSCGYCNVAIGCANLSGQGSFINSGRVGYFNIAIGNNTLSSAYNSRYNIAIGLDAMRGNSSMNGADSNIAIGTNALRCILTGDSNIAIGGNAAYCTDSGTRMIAIGQNAGLSQSNIFGNSTENLYIGDYAGFRTCTSDGNVVVGHFAMCAVGQNASRNTLFGARAGTYLGCSSQHNTFMGYASGYQLRCSSLNNIYIGSFAGYSPTVIDGNTDNIAIGYYAGKNYAGNGNILIGCGMCCTNSTTISERFHLGYGAGNCLLIGCLNSSGRTLCVNGSFSATSKNFAIPHPKPTKTETHVLYHSTVESPTSGDNLYRFEVEVENGQATIDLPDYYKHLNENDQVWVNAKNHFGRAYGVVNQEQTILTVFADQDGEYNVLLIGTRKDKDAVNAWKGTERLKQN